MFAALTAATTGLGIYSNYSAARQQNQAIERSMAEQNKALEVTQQQIAEQAGLERFKSARRAHQIEGKLRVAAGDAGLGMGGTWAALSRQAGMDEAINQAIIQSNFDNQIAAARSGTRANLISLEGQGRNSLLDGLLGGLQGLQTGLSIGNAVGEYNRLQQTPDPDPYTPVNAPTITF